MTRTERRQREKKERKRANCRGQGPRDNMGNDQKKTFPFIGRVVGHVWLYGERGMGGGQ